MCTETKAKLCLLVKQGLTNSVQNIQKIEFFNANTQKKL